MSTSETGFLIRTANKGETYTVACSGEIDSSATKALRDATLLALNSRCPLIVVDLRAVTFMDSTGVHSLLLARKAAEIAGVDLRVRAAPERVMRPLEIAGVDQLFDYAEG
jgi:stage II sporulation protein AA (anti-sigma F factor antagonist)